MTYGITAEETFVAGPAVIDDERCFIIFMFPEVAEDWWYQQLRFTQQQTDSGLQKQHYSIL